MQGSGGDLRDVQQFRRSCVPLQWPLASKRLGTSYCKMGTPRRPPSAPVAVSSSARSMFTRLPSSSPRNIIPPPAPQQNERSRARGGSTTVSGPFNHLARLLVNSAISPQVARIVEHYLFPSSRSHRKHRRVPGEELAVMFDLTSPPNSFQSSPIVRTQCGQMESIFFAFSVFIAPSWIPPVAEQIIVAQPSHRIAGSISLSAARRTSTPRCSITSAQRQDDLAALRIVSAHAAEPQDSIPASRRMRGIHSSG